LPSYLEIGLDIAREAGALLTTYFDRRVAFELKGEHDLVTEADRASERLVVARLLSHFPSHDIVAEEGGGHMRGSEYRWYVDPLDGTTNFAHSFPVYNVTLALERAGELIAGVIYDPTRNEMFAAERGGGATLNGAPIHVSTAHRLQDTLVATGFPSRKRHQNINIHFYYQLAMMTHGVRRAGAAAIDLAYVAAGRLDAFWEFNLNPWDVAAGILIVEEAGGRCSDMKGGPASLHGPHLLADNGGIHAEAVALFNDVFSGKFVHSLPELAG
jgi:myo-inositol-1(or 4)-monophosphatase